MNTHIFTPYKRLCPRAFGSVWQKELFAYNPDVETENDFDQIKKHTCNFVYIN